VTLVSQDRYVRASVSSQNNPPFLPPGGSSDAHEMVATDFGPFAATVTASIPVGSAGAVQDSSLSTSRISGTGSGNASLNVPLNHIICGARGESFVQVEFDVSAPRRYRLIADASMDVPSLTYCFVRIDMHVSSADSTLLNQTLFNNNPAMFHVDQQGLLAPGSYEFYVSLDARVINIEYELTIADHASFGLDLVMQCPADFNLDGSVESQDFFDYLAAFFAGDPSADYTGEGVVNSQDFFEFLAAFFGGC
jgi:hypothetical protein